MSRRSAASRSGNSAIDGFGLLQDRPAADEIPARLDRLAFNQIDGRPRSLSSASFKSPNTARSFLAAGVKVTSKSTSLRSESKSAPRAADPKTSSRATP
jgi:hypothetical protein